MHLFRWHLWKDKYKREINISCTRLFIVYEKDRNQFYIAEREEGQIEYLDTMAILTPPYQRSFSCPIHSCPHLNLKLTCRLTLPHLLSVPSIFLFQLTSNWMAEHAHNLGDNTCFYVVIISTLTLVICLHSISLRNSKCMDISWKCQLASVFYG